MAAMARGARRRRAARGPAASLTTATTPMRSTDQRGSDDGEEHAARAAAGLGGRRERRRRQPAGGERHGGAGPWRRRPRRGRGAVAFRRSCSTPGRGAAEARREGSASASSAAAGEPARRARARAPARTTRRSAGGSPGTVTDGTGRRRRADLHEQVADALALEGQHAGHALVGDDAERPEVRAVVDVAQARALARATCSTACRGRRRSSCCSSAPLARAPP